MSFVPTKYLNFQQNIERNSSFLIWKTKVSKLARIFKDFLIQCQCFVGILSFYIAPYDKQLLRPENIYISEGLTLASLARAYYVIMLHVVNLFPRYIWAPPPLPIIPYQKAGYTIPRVAHRAPVWLAIGASTNLVEKAWFREPLKVPPVGQPKNPFFLRVYL